MIEKLTKYASIITSVFAAGVVLYGIFKFVDQGNKTAETSQVIKKQYKLSKTIDSITNLRLDTLTNIARKTYVKASTTDRKVDNIKNQFTRHLSKDQNISKEELLQILNELDEKKNKRDTILIPWW